MQGGASTGGSDAMDIEPAAEAAVAASVAVAATSSSATPPPPAAEHNEALALFDVYHRGSFTRKGVRDGLLLPLYTIAVFRAPDRMPPVAELQRLRALSGPGMPLRCACAWQQDVMFFDIGYPKDASRRVHGPGDGEQGKAERLAVEAAALAAAAGNDPGEGNEDVEEEEASDKEEEEACSGFPSVGS